MALDLINVLKEIRGTGEPGEAMIDSMYLDLLVNGAIWNNLVILTISAG